MKMKFGNKEILIEYKPIGFVESSLGKLAVFEISGNDNVKVLKQSSPSLKDVPPPEFARRLLPYVLYRADKLTQDGEKPEIPTLSDAEIRALPGDVVEAALELFIASQKHLYKRLVTKPTTNAKGEHVTSLTYGDVEHPKLPDESNVAYLHRLYMLHEKETKRQMAELTGPMLDAAHFSTRLNQSIKDTLLQGDAMSKTWETLRAPAISDFARLSRPIDLTPPLPRINYAAIEQSAAKAQWAPFNAVTKRLDELIELTTASSKFTVQMNQTQTQIAAEIKASSEDANRIGTASLKVAQWGFWLTIVVVILTMVGLGVAAASWWDSDNTTRRAEKQSEQIIRGLSDVKTALVDGGQLSSRDAKRVLDELKAARTEQNSRFDTLLAEQTKILDRQAKQQASDQATIGALQNRIAQLEEDLRKLQAQSTSAKPVQ